MAFLMIKSTFFNTILDYLICLIYYFFNIFTNSTIYEVIKNLFFYIISVIYSKISLIFIILD